MTHPAAVIGLTFDATDLQESDFSIFLEIVRGLNENPTPRGVDLVVPSRAGRIVRNRVADRLTIELRGYISGRVPGDDRGDFRANVQIIRALFDPAAEPADLVASLEDGTTATIAARTINSVWNQITPDLSAVSIELESVDPDWIVDGGGS